MTEDPQRRKRRHTQRQENQGVLLLLRGWLADDTGYDERIWPKVKRSIEEHRLSSRKRFRPKEAP